MSKLLGRILSWSRIRLLMVYALIFLLSGFIGNIWMTRNQTDGLVPSVVYEGIDGSIVRLGFNQTQQKPGLYYFFADWCPICKVQHPVISAIHVDYEVIGIAMQSGDTANVRKYVVSQNIAFKVINDESGNISRSFGVNGVPAAFIVDKTGQIKYSTRGYATEAGLRSRLWLANDNG